MTDQHAYEILQELADVAGEFGDSELVEALKAGACALAAFIRILDDIAAA